MKRDITILNVGDKADFDSYKKIDKEKRYFRKNGFRYATVNYRRLLNGQVDPIKTQKIIVLFFFPFSYWNKYIEHKSYKGIYGNQTFYNKFIQFWDQIEKQCKICFRGKKVFFINKPQLCGAYRDKVTISRKLAEFQIPEPRIHKTISVKAIEAKLARGHKFFLKPRYGSMGKGITFLSRNNWQTNFTVKGDQILSRKSDRGWKFMDVTGNKRFLKQLLTKDIIIQEGVDPLIIDGFMMDLRIYTFLKEVAFVYPRKNLPNKITTNISQGGEGEPKLIKYIPRNLIDKAKREAVRVSESLGIDLAGIDIVPDRNFNEINVIDVNVLSGFPSRKKFNLARYIVRYLSKHKRSNSLRFEWMEDIE